MRERLLPLGRKFAMLPDEIKAKYEHPYSLWSFGWSHGKEKLQGRPDFAKGSYYANPVETVPFKDEAIVKEWPTFAHPNIWPEEDMPELEPAFMKLGKLVVDVGMLVGKLCDEFVSKHTKDEKIITLWRRFERVRSQRLDFFIIFPRPRNSSSWSERVRVRVRTCFRHGVDGTTITVV